MAERGVIDEFVTELGLEVDSRPLEGFSSAIGATVGKLGILVAGALSAASAISSLLDVAAETNQTAKFARGVDVGFEALQRLEFAAQRTGIAAGTLRGVLGGLASSLRGIRTGDSDGFLEALGALGVEAFDDLGRLKDAQQILLEIADAVATATDQDQALGFAQRLGLGPDFAPLLRRGAGGIRALGDEAAALGAILSEDAARSAERFQESIDALNRTVRSFIFENGRPLVDWTTEVAEALLNLARSDGLREAKAEFGALSESIQEVIEGSSELFDRFAQPIVDRLFGAAEAAPVPTASGVGQLAFGVASQTGPLLALRFLSDLNRALQGEDVDPTQAIPGLRLLSRLGDLISEPISGLSALPGAAVDPLRTGGQPIQIEVRNDVQIQGVSDPREAQRLLLEVDQDAVREGLENVRSGVVR